jgi:hypothetical protein
MKRILDYCPETGVTEWFHGSADGKSFSISYEQDCEDIIESNKQKQLAGREYREGWSKDMWRVASIPIIIQMKWMTEHGVDIMNKDHWPAVKRLLNSSDYRYLKTSEVII